MGGGGGGRKPGVRAKRAASVSGRQRADKGEDRETALQKRKTGGAATGSHPDLRQSEATISHLTEPIVKVQVLPAGIRRLECGGALDMAGDTHPIEDLRRGR